MAHAFVRFRLRLAALAFVAVAGCAPGRSSESPPPASPSNDAAVGAPSPAPAVQDAGATALSEPAAPDAAAHVHAEAGAASAPSFMCHEPYMAHWELYYVHRVVPAAHSASEQTAAERHHTAEVAFDGAVAAFKAGRYSASAKGFMDAAAALQRAPNQAFGDIFDADRRVAYENAYVAWEMARAPADARHKLEAALAASPADASILKPMIDGVPASCGATR